MSFVASFRLEVVQITVPKGCCPGCGSKFQSEDAANPGYLQLDKLDSLRSKEGWGAATVRMDWGGVRQRVSGWVM